MDPGDVAIDLPGDRTLVVRPVTDHDVDGLVALYDALDADDRYRRFFSMYLPDRAFFERMAATAERGGDGLVAAVRSADATGDTIVAEAGYELLPTGEGELSIVVARGWRGWLAPYLLERLCRSASARGVPNLVADVLAVNRPMYAMLAARGAVHRNDDDYCVLRLAIGTSGTTPTWPARDGRRRMLLEVPGGRWADVAAAKAAGFDVMVCGGPRGTPSRCPALRGEPCPLVVGADIAAWRPADDETWRALGTAHEAVHGRRPIPLAPHGTLASIDDDAPA